MKQFEKWLLKKVGSPNSAYKYSRAINSISNDMMYEKLLNCSLYEYSNLLELAFVIDKILNNNSFIEKNSIGHNMYSSALKYFIEYKNEAMNFENIEFTQEDTSFPEGKEVLRKHIIRERNQNLIKEAKKKFKLEHKGKLFCEACGFNFSEKYGKIGEDFIEAHHIKPVSEMRDSDKTDINDIVMLCSNCHSMIHRKRPWTTKEKLKNILLKNENKNL